MFIQFDYPRQKWFHTRIFLYALGMSLISIALTYTLFPKQGTISVFLTSFALIGLTNHLFELNKKEIWENITTSFEANKRLAMSLFVLFAGILIGYSFVTLLFRPSTTRLFLEQQLGAYQILNPTVNISQVNFGSFSQLLTHNFSVLLIVLICAVLYRTGGILLIIAWNASVWGVTFMFIAKNTFLFTNMSNVVLTITLLYVSVLCHLTTESLGYILSAMTGFFISKAILQYYHESEKLLRVSKASLEIFLLALVLIILAAYLESNVTPHVVRLLFR